MYRGPTGPNVVIEKIDPMSETTPQTPKRPLMTNSLRTVKSQAKLEPTTQPIIIPSTEEKTIDTTGKPVFKRRPTIILKPKDNKPYLMVKTTRAKEEEKRNSNNLSQVLHP